MRFVAYFLLLFSSCLGDVKSELTKIQIPDEEGGKDWIIELKDDVIIDQYREGVSINRLAKPSPQMPPVTGLAN